MCIHSSAIPELPNMRKSPRGRLKYLIAYSRPDLTFEHIRELVLTGVRVWWHDNPRVNWVLNDGE
jgi:hypothetical protein